MSHSDSIRHAMADRNAKALIAATQDQANATLELARAKNREAAALERIAAHMESVRTVGAQGEPTARQKGGPDA